MARFTLTEEARRDLTEIRDYTSKSWGVRQSQDYLGKLRLTLQNLAKMPDMGQKSDLQLRPDIHHFPVGSHMIYYLAASDGILILAVLHQSRIPITQLTKRL